MNDGNGRFSADGGSGFRANTADFGAGLEVGSRGGNGDEVGNALPGNPHSSSGFRRAIKKAGSSGNSLSKNMVDKTTFGGKNFRKPNYFAQGGQRHGMHIGAGAPHTAGAHQEGADFGGSGS